MIKKVFTLITAAIISFVAFLPSDAAWASPEKKNEPEIKAESAIIYIGDTGEIIWDKNSETKMEPASITKLMTCLLAAENLDLQKEVEITAEAVNVIPTKIYLQAGEKITVEQLMYAALLKSANDAANALAIESLCF